MTDLFLSAHWENLIMANYEVNPEVLKQYLPNGVEIDTYENKAYVSLVGFLFKNTRLFSIPIPFLGTFEEINLRFYVKKTEGNIIKRGVVFISETVPYKAVAWLANKLYNEHYIAIPTKRLKVDSESTQSISYQWKINRNWNHISVNASKESKPMLPNSFEEFIFEHYVGYTKINNRLSQEYKVNHPRWDVHNVMDYSIGCDFNCMYGTDFGFLNHNQPSSVLLAKGSEITINWKRISF